MQQIAFEEYVDAVEVATSRIERLTRAIERSAEGWRFAPVVKQLQALRGVQFVHAVTIICELGDLTRFDSPRQLMAYLGLVPTENSSGERRHQGSITKSGNRFARRALIEAAWAYQHPARVTPDHCTPTNGLAQGRARHRLEGAVAPVRALSKRLCAARLNKNKIVVADCARARRLRLGDRQGREARLSIHYTFIHNSTGGRTLTSTIPAREATRRGCGRRTLVERY